MAGLNRYVKFHAKCILVIGFFLAVILLYGFFEYFSVRKNYWDLWEWKAKTDARLMRLEGK
jgi:hypothetical protein